MQQVIWNNLFQEVWNTRITTRLIRIVSRNCSGNHMNSKLTVVIPTFNRRELTVRAARSVLEQPDPIGTQVLVVDGGSDDGTPEFVEKALQSFAEQGRFKLLRNERTGDPAHNRNCGARNSATPFIAFLDSDDTWTHARLARLAPVLERSDLILCPLGFPQRQETDWLRAYLRTNLGNSSAVVIRRELFEKVGGFPEGYFGPRKRKLSGFEDYEMWLSCLIELRSQGRDNAFIAMNEEDVTIQPQAGSAGFMGIREQMLREALTLLHSTPALSPRYYPLIARRLAGACKAIIFG